MINDIEIAKVLHQSLHGVRDSFTKLATFEYSHDDFFELSSLPTQPSVRLEPENLTHTRQARTVWSSDAVVRLTVVAKLQRVGTSQSTQLDAQTDSLIGFVDEIAEQIRVLKPLGKKALRIESDERYDRELLRNDGAFISTFTVTYSLV